jgi:2,4-dienoyl-CoA reductase-like NADH-dependent reductase (Old Yellow Enzyme family)
MNDILFQPLQFRNLTVKNRLFRSSISGRIDHYDGSGTQARINWEKKFAKGGVGAIISSHIPVDPAQRILPNYAMIDRDDLIPFWKEVVKSVHEYDCKFIGQLSMSGHQQDIRGVENRYRLPLSSVDGSEHFHGITGKAMSTKQISEAVRKFAEAAGRARAAGMDGVELHASNGYLFTQFLSSAINNRKDEYGGSLENRARFLMEVVEAVRAETGDDYHFQVKMNAADHHDDYFLNFGKGNTLNEGITVARWLEKAGVDALHVSVGSQFPHPRNPIGPLPVESAAITYPAMIPSGHLSFWNYLTFRYKIFWPLIQWLWRRKQPDVMEGINLAQCKAIKDAVTIPVLCTGGFQTASLIRNALENSFCDGVTIARPLMANPTLPLMFKEGLDGAPKPCSYCNKCLAHVLVDPLGCYDESRYDSYEEMMDEIMSIFKNEYF